MAGKLDKLEPYIRREIYRQLFQFDLPLKRIKHAREHYIIEKRPVAASKKPAIAVNVAILLTCKTTHREALPWFFTLNTFSLIHSDICLSERFMRRKPRAWRLIRDAVVFDRPKTDPGDAFTKCPDCASDVPRFLDIFTEGDFFRKLKSVKIILEHQQPSRRKNDKDTRGYPLFGDFQRQRWHLRNYDMEVTFTGIGRFTVKDPSGPVEIQFQHQPPASLWPRFLRDDDAALSRLLELAAELGYVSTKGTNLAAYLTQQHQEFRAGRTQHQSYMRLFNLHSEAEVWERITDTFLLQLPMQGGKDKVASSAAI